MKLMVFAPINVEGDVYELFPADWWPDNMPPGFGLPVLELDVPTTEGASMVGTIWAYHQLMKKLGEQIRSQVEALEQEEVEEG